MLGRCSRARGWLLCCCFLWVGSVHVFVECWYNTCVRTFAVICVLADYTCMHKTDMHACMFMRARAVYTHTHTHTHTTTPHSCFSPSLPLLLSSYTKHKISDAVCITLIFLHQHVLVSGNNSVSAHANKIILLNIHITGARFVSPTLSLINHAKFMLEQTNEDE